MKQKIFILFILAIALGPVLSGCSKGDDYEYSQKTVKTSQVSKKQSEDFLVFSGNLEGNKETVIAAKVPGQISLINVNIGDFVKKGDLLVTLSGEENFSERNTANNAYQNSLSNLQKTEYLMKQEISKAEASLKSAEQSLLSIKTADLNEDIVSAEQIKQAKLDLEKAKIARESIDNTFKQKEKDVLASINSAISQSLIVAKNALAYLYLINNENFSEVDNGFEVDSDFVSNIDDRNQVAMLTKKARTKYFELEKTYDNMDKSNLLSDQLISQGDSTEEILNDVKKALQAMNDIVLSAVSHVDMPEDQLGIYKNNLNNYILQIENILLSQDSGVAIGLMGVRQALENLSIEKESQVKQINKDIEKAVKQLEVINANIESLKDDLEGKTRIAESQLELAEGNLGSARAQQDTQLQMAKSRVDLARGELNMANVNVANTRLRAPYDGVVMERLVDEGSVVNAGTPILKVADVTSYKLVIFVPESQTRQIKIGQIATATVDSLPGEDFLAIVERISPKSEDSSKKVRVELKIESNEYLKIGMYMNLKVQIDKKDLVDKEVLVIPLDALIIEGGKNYVWTVFDGVVHKKEIEIGQMSDMEVEVLKGLKIDEEIIYKGFDALIEGEKVVVKN